MKTFIIVILALTLGYFAFAQTSNPFFATTTGDHTTCPAGTVWCLANDGEWRHLASDATAVRVDIVTASVATVNGKTPTNGNVSIAYADLASKPTTLKCNTSDQSNTGFSASACVQQ